jgi:3-hydroxybutyrate dehydrogenase
MEINKDTCLFIQKAGWLKIRASIMNENSLIILLTGGAGGLGRKIAEHLYNRGYSVYVFDKVLKVEIEPSFLRMLAGYTGCDLSNTDELEACMGTLINQTERIDVLINNASVRQFKKLSDFDTNEIQRNIDADFLAPVILSNLCLPIMKKNNFGRIINISSISAYKGYSAGSLYCSSKRALITFSESLGKELNNLRGTVTVNTICPGSFSKADGTILKNHRRITDSILVNIGRIIQSEENGRIINVFTFQNKLMESLRFIKQAFQTLIS